MAKPIDLPIWDETEERVTQPDVTRQQTGFVWSGTKFEKPKGEHFNWLFNNIYKWVKYFDEVLNINALTEKTTLNSNDEFLIEDSEDSNAKKKAKLSSIASLVSAPPIASTEEAQAGINNTNFITPLRMREGFNASGPAPVYACRAWVNFNGTGTVAIRASGNVSSITDNGVGDYTVNFTVAFQDVNYSIFTGVGKGNIAVSDNIQGAARIYQPLNTLTSTRINIINGTASDRTDADCVNVTIFR